MPILRRVVDGYLLPGFQRKIEMERMARTRRKMGLFTQCIYRAVSNAIPVMEANVTMNVALIAREPRCWLRSVVRRAGGFEDPLVSKSRR